jgi:DNA polymerase sigma
MWGSLGAADVAAGAQAVGLSGGVSGGPGSGEERGSEAVEADDPRRARRKTKDERAGPRKRRPRKHRQTSAVSAEGGCDGDDGMTPTADGTSEAGCAVAGTAESKAQSPPARPFPPAAAVGRGSSIRSALMLSVPLRADAASPRLGLYRSRANEPPEELIPVRAAAPAVASFVGDGPNPLTRAPPGFALPDHHGAREASYSEHRPEQLAALTKSTPQPPSRTNDEDSERSEREYWTRWVIEAAEKERARRLNVLRQLQMEEEEEIRRRRQWAIAAIEKEQEAMMREMFLDNMKNTQWFQSTISRFSEDYEVVCPNSWFGCTFSCMLKDLEQHLESCVFRQVPDTLDQVVEEFADVDFYSYDVVCPNAVLGCKEICSRENLAQHLASCPVNGISREKEWEERLEWRRSVILASEQERERRMHELSASNGAELSFGHLQRLYEEQTAMLQVVLHDEIVDFYQHAQQEALSRRSWVDAAILKVKREMVTLWGDKVHVEGYGSFVTGLYGSASDVDLVVFGVSDTQHLSCQQCVSVLASHLQKSKYAAEFVEISALTRASIPLLKVVIVVTIEEIGVDSTAEATAYASDHGASSTICIPFDITFDEPNGIWHNGVASAALVNTLATHFYGLRELAMVLKHFLVKRRLNDPYVGGLSSYGLLLMILFILQEQNAVIPALDELHVGGIGDTQLSSFGEMKPAAECTEPVAASFYEPANSRCEIQRRKGEMVAREIIRQSNSKQQQRRQQQIDGSSEKSVKRKKRPALPTLLTGTDSEHEQKPFLLGKLLMDFLHFYGNDFRQGVDQVCVLNREDIHDPELLDVTMATPSPSGIRSLHASPSHGSSPTAGMSPLKQKTQLSPGPMALTLPSGLSESPPASLSAASLAQDGVLVLHDPLQLHNNVGKSCYRVSQVFRELSDFLSFLTALIVRGSVMTTGKKKQSVQPHNGGSTTEVMTAQSSSASASPTPLRSAPSSSPQASPRLAPVSIPTYRILLSVFEMK